MMQYPDCIRNSETSLRTVRRSRTQAGKHEHSLGLLAAQQSSPGLARYESRMPRAFVCNLLSRFRSSGSFNVRLCRHSPTRASIVASLLQVQVGKAKGTGRRPPDTRPGAHHERDSTQVRGVANDWVYQREERDPTAQGAPGADAKFW